MGIQISLHYKQIRFGYVHTALCTTQSMPSMVAFNTTKHYTNRRQFWPQGWHQSVQWNQSCAAPKIANRHPNSNTIQTELWFGFVHTALCTAQSIPSMVAFNTTQHNQETICATGLASIGPVEPKLCSSKDRQ